MKEKVKKIIENHYLDPTEIDSVFFELCSFIGAINNLGEIELTNDKLLKKLTIYDRALENLESRSQKLNIAFLTSQIKKYRSLISTLIKEVI